MAGAGFDVEDVSTQGESVWVEARRARTLADIVGPGHAGARLRTQPERGGGRRRLRLRRAHQPVLAGGGRVRPRHPGQGPPGGAPSRPGGHDRPGQAGHARRGRPPAGRVLGRRRAGAEPGGLAPSPPGPVRRAGRLAGGGRPPGPAPACRTSPSAGCPPTSCPRPAGSTRRPATPTWWRTWPRRAPPPVPRPRSVGHGRRPAGRGPRAGSPLPAANDHDSDQKAVRPDPSRPASRTPRTTSPDPPTTTCPSRPGAP